MSKKTVIFILSIISTMFPVFAFAQQNTNNEIKLQIHQGDMSINKTGEFAHPTPGSQAPMIYVIQPASKESDGYGIWSDELLERMSIDMLERYSSGHSGSVERIGEVLARVPENNISFRFLRVVPKDIGVLAGYKGENPKDGLTRPLIAKMLVQAKKETNGRYAYVECWFKSKPVTYGVAPGAGATKVFGDIAAAFGIPFQWNSAEDFVITKAQVHILDGTFNLPELPFANEQKQEPTSARPVSAPPAAAPTTEKKPIVTDDDLHYTGIPIFFGFNEDRPLPGQEDAIKQMAVFLGPRLNMIKKNGYEVYFVGFCDGRGPENYNFGLGGRRPKSVAYPVMSLLENAGATPEEKTLVREFCLKHFRIVSAGKNDPHFTLADAKRLNQSEERIHLLNRRVDLVIVKKNLTADNIEPNLETIFQKYPNPQGPKK